MQKIEELEQAVASLPENEYSQFWMWFLDQDWHKWDQEIENDSRDGKLDFLIQEALEAKNKSKLSDL
jgi:hypothetical protein